jgi:undecaprenyl-diphosphatase
VQLVKRSVERPRPSSRVHCDTLVAEPPCFSFPSGHATAAMSVAFMYAAAFPSYAIALMALAVAVGFSRVRLGVHYPGDVLAGQLIALISDIALLALW